MSERDKQAEKALKWQWWANYTFSNAVAIVPLYCEYVTPQLVMAFYVLADWSHYSLQPTLIYPDGIGFPTSPCYAEDRASHPWLSYTFKPHLCAD
jgi:hypothetical protein